ncbi:hypothetical protein TruAng_010528 [Truncatella angustata]|nr:hypothetical protein TruAng_010528 [Truncatella angustata]
MAVKLASQIGLDEVSPGEYVSAVLPERMGNTLPIAYGGCTLGVATHAACKTVPASHSLYSLVGHFLGPASTTEKLHCTVHKTRDTRTFATRRVQVSQVKPDGNMRICMELLADFQIEEPALLTYSSPPAGKYSGPEQSQTLPELVERAVSEGQLSKEAGAQAVKSFELGELLFESRFCPEGVCGQNALGILKQERTTQDHLPITEKTTADWIRSRESLETRGERMSATAFMLDGALSFMPLNHNHMWLDDAGACSTLDFALRFFVPDLALDAWHLRERKTTAAGFGRSYSEGMLWDEKGTLVASMTQQCIVRPKSDGKLKTKL